MKTKTNYYSSDWGLPEEEYFDIPPRDPAFVDLTEICLPLDECLTVELGPINQATLSMLEQRGFDQAPVQVPGAELGWRLVATTQLKALLEAGKPFDAEDSNFLESDSLGFYSSHRSVPVQELILH